MLKGVAASAGIAVGTAVVVRTQTVTAERRTVSDLAAEGRRFLEAVEVFAGELQQAIEKVTCSIGEDEATILRAQVSIVRDPDLIREVLRIIERNQVNAEYAFSMICNGYITLFSHHEDATMNARSADFEDIRDRMLRILLDVRKVNLRELPEGSVIIADDIHPSQAPELDGLRIRGIVTRCGTKFSHISIIARALQLPAVVAVPDIFEHLREGEAVIVDGHNGHVHIRPAPQMVSRFLTLSRAEQGRQEPYRYRDQPACTRDGYPLRISANMSLPQELEAICETGADGIGLLRTEILYMGRSDAPSEQEQFETYRAIAEKMDGKPVTVRTLDIGGDKTPDYIQSPDEENPALGCRGIRHSLTHPELFCDQLAALLRASAYGNLRILLPMVSCLSELRRAHELLRRVQRDLSTRSEPFRKDVPLGVMIETPAAALQAADLAAECDFFSIGTNDLTQYVLAVDRSNPSVTALYNNIHPAVLRIISMVVKAAHGSGRSVCICGESAADPMLIPFLLGIGVDELSINTGMMLSVCRLVSTLRQDHCSRHAGILQQLADPDAVRDYIIHNLLPESEPD